MPWGNPEDYYEKVDQKEVDNFRAKFIGEWEPLKRQCMMRTIKLPNPTQCPNEAWFTVVRKNGEAQDVCRYCLLVACDAIGDGEVVVMKVKQRRESKSYRVDL